MTAEKGRPSLGSRLWADEALTTREQDELGRGPYIDRAAQAIQLAGRASTVYAVTGAWGSGKTSVLNLAVERLKQLDGSWSVVPYNPWAASDINSLIAELFACISSALPHKGAKAAKKALIACGQVALPILGEVPLAGDMVQSGMKYALEQLAKEGDWQRRFEKAASEIERLDIRVLVTVDDVDRLQGDELVALLKALRLLGRFPGVHYVMAYDPAAVRETLGAALNYRTSSETSVDAFLEKFVQVPLPMPAVQPVQIRRLIDVQLDGLLEQLGLELSSEDRNRYGFARDHALAPALSTVRGVKRFFMQATLYLELTGPREVNLVDFLLMTLLQQSFPDVFRDVWDHRDELTRSDARVFLESMAAHQPLASFDWMARLNALGIQGGRQEAALWTLTLLFPSARFLPEGNDGLREVVGHAYANANADQRASSEEYLPRYFAFGVPEDDVSDELVDDSLDAMSERPDDSVRILQEVLGALRDDHGLTSRVFAKMQARTRMRARLHRPNMCLAVARAYAQEIASLGDPVSPFDEAAGSWLATELTLVGGDADAAELYASVLRGLNGDLARLLRAIVESLGDRQLKAALHRLAMEDTPDRVLVHLAAGDEAPLQSIHVLLDAWADAAGVEAQERLAAGLAAGSFDVATLASRLVSIRWPYDGAPAQQVGLDWPLLSRLVDKQTLQTAAPFERRDFDETDITWPSRRAGAEAALAEWLDRPTHPDA